LNVSYHIKCC